MIKGRSREDGFTLIEVVLALAIIAVTAMMLLDRRVDIVRDAGRSRSVRIAWMLAAQKLAELELDPTLWQGQGGGSNGDFAETDPAYAVFTWEYLAARIPVETLDPQEALEAKKKPKEIFRVGLKIDGPELGQPILLEAMFPVSDGKPVKAPAGDAPPGTPGTPPSGAPGAAPVPPPPGGGTPK